MQYFKANLFKIFIILLFSTLIFSFISGTFNFLKWSIWLRLLFVFQVLIGFSKLDKI